MKTNKKKTGIETETKIEYEYCKVCRINHNKGPKHKYFPSHKNTLTTFLSKFLSKVSQIRSSLKNPNPNFIADSRLWCFFCDSDIRSYAIHHLASMDHLKNVKHFMWKYGSGNYQFDAFCISQNDLAKWEKKCKSLNCEGATSSIGSCCLPNNNGDSNDIQNELDSGNITRFENNNSIQSLKSGLSKNVMPLHYNTNEYQVSSYSGIKDVAINGPSLRLVTSPLPASPLFSASTSLGSNEPTAMWSNSKLAHYDKNRCSVGDYSSNEVMHQESLDQKMVNGGSSSQGYLNLARISLKAPGDGENVHSGAPPPWLEADEINQHSVQLKPDSRSGKSHKLNPKRVGAAWAERRKIELEKEKRGEIEKNDYDDGWLPNFGRVWQSGSRKESRKEFEDEKDKIFKPESHSEVPIPVHPYVSKRMRRDTSES